MLGLALPMTGALGAALFLPRAYRATATLVVERAGVGDDEVDARLSLLKSENLRRSRLSALIERFHLYPTMQDSVSPELIIDQMQKDVVIEVDKEERNGRRVVTAIRVTYAARDPQVAANVANDLAAFYEREDLRMRELRAAQTRSQLQLQLADARRRLDTQEARLRDYKREHLSELPEQVGLHLAALEQLNSRIRAHRSKSARRSGRASSSAGSDALVEPGRDMRLDRLRDLQLRFTAEHPDVKALKREIAKFPFVPEVDTVGRFEAQRGAEADLDEAQRADADRARVGRTREQVAELQRAAAEHEREILNAPFHQQALDALLPDYVAARTLYQSLWEKYEVAQLWDPRQSAGRLRVLDPAVPRNDAVSPNVPRVVAMGVVLALASVVGMVVAAERIDTSFHTLTDLRAFTRVPVLANVPRFVTPADKRREKRKARRFAVMLLLIVATVLVGAVFLSTRGDAFVAWMRSAHL